MLVHEAAVVGSPPVAMFGGSRGNRPDYSHAAELRAAGFCLGAEPTCMRLSRLQVQKNWKFLSHHSATYASINYPLKTFTPRGRCNFNVNLRTDYTTEFNIPADHRVRRVCVAAEGERARLPRDRGLTFLEIETVPVNELEDSHPQVTSIGCCRLHTGDLLRPGTHKWDDGDLCRVLIIPKGLTLVGIDGEAGDHWNQVSLLVGLWLPMGGWSASIHKHLVTPFKQQARTLLLCLHQLQRTTAIQPLNKQLNECLVAALYDATFMAPPATGSTQPAAAEGTQVPPPATNSTQQAAAEGAQAPPPANSSTQHTAVSNTPHIASSSRGFTVSRGSRGYPGSRGRQGGRAYMGRGRSVQLPAAESRAAPSGDFVALGVWQQVQEAKARCQAVVRVEEMDFVRESVVGRGRKHTPIVFK